MDTGKLKKGILDAVCSSEKIKLIQEFEKSDKENETLFFLKPEFFQLKDFKFTEPLLDFIFEKIKEFNIEISGVLNLKAEFLKEKKIVERHYGVINKLSVNGSKIISKNDKEKIKDALKIKDLSGYKILGGHEIIQKFKNISEERLTKLWYEKNGYRIGEGFYVQLHAINNEKIILINGFNPSQIKHYTSTGSQIVLFLLETDTEWSKLRDDMVGDTFPEKAKDGSVRHVLYNNSKKFGIREINVAKNFVHASSGPFDALFEICNFVGNIDNINICAHDTNIYQLMVKKFNLTIDDFDICLENPVRTIDSREFDLFGFTKNKNTFEAIRDYIKYFKD
jgi:nucleoside diphosphate kinase